MYIFNEFLTTNISEPIIDICVHLTLLRPHLRDTLCILLFASEVRNAIVKNKVSGLNHQLPSCIFHDPLDSQYYVISYTSIMEVSVETFSTNIKVRDCTILQLLQKNLCTYTEEGGRNTVCTNHKRVSLRGRFPSICSYIITSKLYIFPLMAFIFPRIFGSLFFH